MVTTSDITNDANPRVILLSSSGSLTKAIQSMLGDIIDVIQVKSISEAMEMQGAAKCILIDLINRTAFGELDLETMKETANLPRIAIIAADDNITEQTVRSGEYFGFIRLPIEADGTIKIIIKAIFKSNSGG